MPLPLAPLGPGTALAMALLTLVMPPAQAAPGAHQHGVVTLEVAIDGAELSLGLRAPLDDLIGFERAPRTPAERQAAAELLRRLRAPGALFEPTAAAGCTLAAATVQAPVLEGGPADPDHAELSADYRYTCAQPKALRGLKHRLFAEFRRIARIEAAVAGPRGQGQHKLKRPADTLVWPQ